MHGFSLSINWNNFRREGIYELGVLLEDGLENPEKLKEWNSIIDFEPQAVKWTDYLIELERAVTMQVYTIRGKDNKMTTMGAVRGGGGG